MPLNLSNPQNLLIAGIYYLLVAVISFFSLFGVYILIRYGRSKPLVFAISLLYAFVFLQILTASYLTLQGLLVVAAIT